VALVGSYELLMVVIRSAQAPSRAVAMDRAPDAPSGDPLQEHAAEVLAGEVAAGLVPSVRTIRAKLHVGQPRAQRVRAYLTALVNAQRVAVDRADVDDHSAQVTIVILSPIWGVYHVAAAGLLYVFNCVVDALS
jgi:hypothetical protein